MDAVQIIMISYFRPNDFERSVQSVLNNTAVPFHLSIIDNSHGGLDAFLDKYESHPKVTIYRNETNVGKGIGVMRWYPQIMQSTSSDYFISIDADIEVYPNWLPRLYAARKKIAVPFGILAPVIMNKYGEWFITQKSDLVMHNQKIFYHIVDEIYYNRHTAGPLFLIDREFFESVGGYSQNQLYGSDDGKLCKAAANQDRFIGIAANVHVLHLRQDDGPGYQEWKLKHVNTDGVCKGYWDQD